MSASQAPATANRRSETENGLLSPQREQNPNLGKSPRMASVGSASHVTGVLHGREVEDADEDGEHALPTVQEILENLSFQ